MKTPFLFFALLFSATHIHCQDSLGTLRVKYLMTMYMNEQVDATETNPLEEPKSGIMQKADLTCLLTPAYIKVSMTGKELAPKTTIRNRQHHNTTELTQRNGKYIKRETKDADFFVEESRFMDHVKEFTTSYIDTVIQYKGFSLKKVILSAKKSGIETEAWYCPDIPAPALSSTETVCSGMQFIEGASLVPYLIFVAVTHATNGMAIKVAITDIERGKPIRDSEFVIPGKYVFE